MAESNSNSKPKSVGLAETEEIRSCLIGGFSWVNPISGLKHFNPLVTSDGSVCSIDNVRVALKLGGVEDSEWLVGHLDTLDCDSPAYYPQTRKTHGGWVHVWRLGFGESTATVGIGLVGRSLKPDVRKAFIEANPNKVGADPRFWNLVEMLASRTRSAEVKRYDLAIDVHRAKNKCRVTKDHRMYTCRISNGVTEELGKRNTAGHVRCYDKQAESGLEMPLTRVELTCDGLWDKEAILDHWPQVHAWTVTEQSRSWVSVLGMAFSELSENGSDVETLVSCLGYDARKKVRESLRGSMIELPAEALDYAIDSVRFWTDSLNHI